MTTLYLTNKNCSVCGESNRYPLVDLSRKLTGVRDLDGRPSHIQRSLVYMWIQRCESCSYCAPDISLECKVDPSYLNSQQYKAIINDVSFPLTAVAFRAHSFLMMSMGLFADSAWAQLCAAWVCDDNSAPANAVVCRKEALSLFRCAQEKNQEFSQSHVEENLILIDIMRRTGDFNAAWRLCEEELVVDHPDSIWTLLEYEKILIGKKDVACHNESDADEQGE
jgi:hypothetical protein